MSPLRSYLRRNAPGLVVSLVVVLATAAVKVGEIKQEDRVALERQAVRLAWRVQVAYFAAIKW
jgi:hypothetical protein